MQKQDTKNKKNVVVIVLLIFLLITVIFGVTYSIFIYGKAGYKKNTISTSSIVFTFDETTNGIVLENAMPMADEVGKKLTKDEGISGYFDFNVGYNTSADRTINYEIYATPEYTDNDLEEEYVKVYLTDQNDIPIYKDNTVKTYNQLEKSKVDSKSKQLYYGSFTKSDSKKFRLRLWISDKYEVTSVSKKFKLKVNVEATES